MAEISLFPMAADYAQTVKDFVEALAASGLDVTTSETSTILRGRFDQVMPLLTRLMRDTLSSGGKKAIVLKMLN